MKQTKQTKQRQYNIEAAIILVIAFLITAYLENI
jgi:hypothetical protein